MLLVHVRMTLRQTQAVLHRLIALRVPDMGVTYPLGIDTELWQLLHYGS